MCKQNEKDSLIFFASLLIDITRRLTTLNRYFFECALHVSLRPLLDLKRGRTTIPSDRRYKKENSRRVSQQSRLQT
jgi:hypothetical protein